MLRTALGIFNRGVLKQKRTECLRLTSTFNDKTSSSSDSDESSDAEDRTVITTKNLILKSALSFVPQHGWSKRSIALGAEKEGLPGTTHGLFERGEIELVEFFYQTSNEQLCNMLSQQQQQERKPTDVFLHDAISNRLKMLRPYIDTWPEAMALMSIPNNVPNALVNLSKLVDDIWYYAGDRSTTFDWYTKRASLAMVYGSTQLYMIQDDSHDYGNTWIFLSRQLSFLKQAGTCRKQCETLFDSAGSFLWGAANVARNVASFNVRQR